LSDKLRVHTLSKELGVTSKAIIDKCKSEGVEGVTNHMSAVSAGLAETIREWFSIESHGTAIEEAAPVDIASVRVRRRAPRKKKAEADESPAAEPAVVVETATPPVAEPAAPEPEAEQVPEEPVSSPAAETVVPAEPAVVQVEPLIAPSEGPPSEPPQPPAEPVIAKPAAQAPAPAPPPQPEVIRPAGPQNIPAPAQMRGPKVVGFAKPDPIHRPVPRSASRGPVSPEPPDTDAAGPKRGGRGKKGSLFEEAAPGKGGRQRANPRRSVTSLHEVGERLKEWNDRDLLERQERLQQATGRGIHHRAREKKTEAAPTHIAPRKTKAQVTEPIVLHELCSATGVGMAQLLPRLIQDHAMGLVHRNTVVPTDVAELLMLDFGVEIEVVKPKTEMDKLVEEFAARERKELQPRPPVVTMLGHVDHGKTSLLDAIRKTSVAAGEAGGITQHIGAYRVERGSLSVTFLDTPGHEAFTSMRARGANLTDVVVLVVAADDGVMPQTIEAINHAKAAKVTIIVALNKIDLPGADINKIYGQLSERGLAPTEWGGDVDVVKTSAVTGQGVEELVDHLATLSELLNLRADPTLPATGTVIEAQMTQGIGPVARVLVREGTLRTGDCLVCGTGAGRVRVMRDDRGRQLDAAPPGYPVEVAGLDEVPRAGENFYVIDSLQRAKEIAEQVKIQRREETLTRSRKPQTLEELLRKREGAAVPELNLILRADVQGSVDALLKALGEIPSDQVKLNFLHTGIGTVTEGDVVLAAASQALVVGFSVTVDATAQKLAEVEGVDIRLYRVIYNLIDDVRNALEGLLPTDKSEEKRGRADVREVFHVSRVGSVAGCMVTEGPVLRSHYVRVIRDGQIIVPSADDVKRGRHRGINSLRRFKDDVREVRAGMECGLKVEDFDDLKPGDVIETYEIVETVRKL
jgi:translation initiation factor IF-2